MVELAHGVVEHVFYKLGAPLRPIALAEQPPSRIVVDLICDNLIVL